MEQENGNTIITLEDLARMVARGFEETAKKADMEARFNNVDKRFDRVDERLDKVEERLDTVDGRLDHMDARMGRMEADLGEIRVRGSHGTRKVYGNKAWC
jgi:tetrahydromethanopterin S-methyltransferase subunit G